MFRSRFQIIGAQSSKSDKSISDVRCIELIRSGDSSALELLFRKYYPRLCQYAYRSVESPEVAEDIVQSVFLNIWKNRKEWDPQCTPVMYLYKATKNRVINHLKHRTIENFAEFIDVNSLYIDEQTPEDTYRESECSDAIQSSINRLPERCRLIFLMKKEDGLTYKEIAEILDISTKTVETQMVRAFRYLRETLAEYSRI
jgi:RNA polymerase sigma-70 factor, ECF subfamily